jgi:hypothetical protein
MSRQKKIDSEIGASPEMAEQTTVAESDRECIALRAYELYLARGAVDGQAEDDWYTAERQLATGEPSSRES